MKKVALISTYCDTQEKIDILSKNIDKLRVFGLDVIVITPIILPETIQKKCDYYFQTKDNPVLTWPQKAIFFWKDLFLDGKKIRIFKTDVDYGWAGLYQVKKLSEIGLSFEYDYFYHMIYDLKFDKTVIEGLIRESECDIYSSKRKHKTWEVGLHFMSFNREKLQTFISHITLQNYLNFKGGDAFAWLLNLKNDFPYNIVEKHVEDEIFYYENIDVYNSSPIIDLKFFIDKNDEKDSTVKILFYDVQGLKNGSFKVGDEILDFQISTNTIIDLGFKKQNIPTVTLEYNNMSYCLTNIIKKIKHNAITEIS